MLVGPSSGAVLKVACEVANRPEMAGKTVVAVQASSGVRYLAHPLWEAEKTEAGAALPVPPNLEDEFPILRWSSEDYAPPVKE